MAPSSPAMMEPTPMTAPVPMMTPSTVRNERILCSRMVVEGQTDSGEQRAEGHFSALSASMGSSRAARRAG